eukprot:gene11153-23313_t
MSFSKYLIDKGILDKTIEAVQRMLHAIAYKLPDAEKIVIKFLDSIFIPRQIMTQVIIAIGIHTGLVSFQAITSLLQYFVDILSEKGNRKRKIQLNMENANSYGEWKHLAEQLDEMLGLTKWREIENSPLYDSRVLKKRIYDLRSMIRRNDVFGLMFRLRGGLARDQYGMQHEGLFTKATAGTKLLVEEYHDTVASALTHICDDQIGEEE